VNWNKAFTELGKQFLNVAVAGLIFAFIQPLVHEKLIPKTALFSVCWYITFTLAGVVLISIGEEENGRSS